MCNRRIFILCARMEIIEKGVLSGYQKMRVLSNYINRMLLKKIGKNAL